MRLLVDAPAPPTIVADPDWAVEELSAWPTGTWPRGIGHLLRRNRTVRPAEVEYDGRRLEVRTFTGASPDDLVLAAAFARRAGPVEIAEGPPDLGEGTLTAWAKQGAAALLKRARDTGKALQLFGPYERPWIVGPRLAADVARWPDPETELLGRARRLLWASQDEELFIAKTKYEDGFLFSAGVVTLFLDASHVVLEKLDLSKTVSVSIARLVERVPGVVRLDERAVLAPAVDATAWDSLVDDLS